MTWTKKQIQIFILIFIIIFIILFFISKNVIKNLENKQEEVSICQEDIISCDEVKCITGWLCYKGDESWVEKIGDIKIIKYKKYK